MLPPAMVFEADVPAIVWVEEVQASYALAFDPSNGFFMLTGTGVTPTPEHLQVVVTEANSSIVITCEDGLSFDTGDESLVRWSLSNTMDDPYVLSATSSSIEIMIPTPPQPHDRVSFTLNTQYTSSSSVTINDLQLDIYVTAATLGPLPDLELVYTPANGTFSLESSTGDEILQAEVAFRLGTNTDDQGGAFLVHLTTAGNPPPGMEAVFAEDAVILSNGDTIERVDENTVLLNLPFQPNGGIGMNFIIQYKGVKIYSPDPIIVDKTVGSNPGPGF